MQWLVAHMWMALVATGILGLLFGWAVRGLRLRGRLHRAEGERNIALGSLEEKEAELEAFYAAQRVSDDNSEGAAIVEVSSSDNEVQKLNDALAKAREEISALRQASKNSETSGDVATVVGSAVAGAVIADQAQRLDAGLDREQASLEWRNRYLESRVRNLEGKVQEMAIAEPQPSAIASTDDESANERQDVRVEKLRWQNDYLKQRLGYFERYGQPLAVVSRAASAEPSGEPASTSEALEGPSTSEEEIAQLRWRNRYLEGRLAYYEGDKDDAVEEDSGIAELADSTAAMVLSDDTDTIETIEPTDEQLVESDDSSGEVTQNEYVPFDSADAADSDKDIEASEDESVDEPKGVRPIALDSPVGGEGDDLTAIGGIGPKIQEVLNGFGVYHYDQIAAWTPENIQWVDDHLAFEGRIEREQWVQQAEALTSVE